MPRANATANKATVKKADQVMENQLEIPDFNFGQPVKEQPEVNVQVVFEKGAISSDHRSPRLISTNTVSTETIRDVIPAS